MGDGRPTKEEVDAIAAVMRHVREAMREFRAKTRDGSASIRYTRGQHAAIANMFALQDFIIRNLIRRLQVAEGKEYRGVWAANERYLKGCQVSHAGSLWTATADLVGVKPGDGQTLWRLSVKRGRGGG